MTTPLAMAVDAVASRIDTAGLGYWNPNSAYPPAPERTPIYGKRFPPKAPDTAIAINCYSIEMNPDPGQPVERIRVQVRSRAKGNADDVGDPILTLLHGKHHEQWGALIVQRCRHLSTAQLGVDSQGLDERTDNYELEII